MAWHLLRYTTAGIFSLLLLTYFSQCQEAIVCFTAAFVPDHQSAPVQAAMVGIRQARQGAMYLVDLPGKIFSNALAAPLPTCCPAVIPLTVLLDKGLRAWH